MCQLTFETWRLWERVHIWCRALNSPRWSPSIFHQSSYLPRWQVPPHPWLLQSPTKSLKSMMLVMFSNEHKSIYWWPWMAFNDLWPLTISRYWRPPILIICFDAKVWLLTKSILDNHDVETSKFCLANKRNKACTQFLASRWASSFTQWRRFMSILKDRDSNLKITRYKIWAGMQSMNGLKAYLRICVCTSRIYWFRRKQRLKYSYLVT